VVEILPHASGERIAEAAPEPPCAVSMQQRKTRKVRIRTQQGHSTSWQAACAGGPESQKEGQHAFPSKCTDILSEKCSLFLTHKHMQQQRKAGKVVNCHFPGGYNEPHRLSNFFYLVRLRRTTEQRGRTARANHLATISGEETTRRRFCIFVLSRKGGTAMCAKTQGS